jgi:hypothetical protein
MNDLRAEAFEQMEKIVLVYALQDAWARRPAKPQADPGPPGAAQGAGAPETWRKVPGIRNMKMPAPEFRADPIPREQIFVHMHLKPRAGKLVDPARRMKRGSLNAKKYLHGQ